MDEQISVAELDNALEKYVDARAEYELQKKMTDELKQLADVREKELMELLEKAGKDSWNIDGLAKVSVYEKLSVTTPKTGEAKRDFFGWIFQQYGQDGLDKYMTVNSVSLNSLYNTVVGEANARGEVLIIPGLDLPVSNKVLSLRRSK